MATRTKTTEALAAFVAEAAKLGKFTLKEAGGSAYVAAAAVKAGYIKATKQSRKSGGRGRPATVYTVTAKGKKLA